MVAPTIFTTSVAQAAGTRNPQGRLSARVVAQTSATDLEASPYVLVHSTQPSPTTGVMFADGQPAEVGAGPYRWEFGSTVFNSINDHIMRLGYNEASLTGDTSSPTEPVFGWAVESHYFDGTTHFMEMYWEYQGIDRSKQARPLTANVDRVSHNAALTFTTATPVLFKHAAGGLASDTISLGVAQYDLRLANDSGHRWGIDENSTMYIGYNLARNRTSHAYQYDQTSALAGVVYNNTGQIDWYAAASALGGTAVPRSPKMSLLVAGPLRINANLASILGLTLASDKYGIAMDTSDLCLLTDSTQGLNIRGDSITGRQWARFTAATFTLNLALAHAGTKVGFNGVTPVVKAAAIPTPTSDILGTKSAIDAIRAVLTNLGLSA